jgi:hypothetical protein
MKLHLYNPDSLHVFTYLATVPTAQTGTCIHDVMTRRDPSPQGCPGVQSHLLRPLAILIRRRRRRRAVTSWPCPRSNAVNSYLLRPRL